MAEYHCSHLPPCHEGCLQPRHNSVLLLPHKKLSSLSPRVSVCFSPQLCFHRSVIICRPLLSFSPLIAPISRPPANNEPVGQMFIVFVCNMFTFQKFGISSLHIGELHSHMRGGEGALESLNMPPECPVPSIIYHLTICRRPSPSPASSCPNKIWPQ